MKIALGKLFATALLTLGIVLPLNAVESLRLANSFGRSMVLQRDMPVPVWGWSRPQAEITVAFRGQKKTARADADGRAGVTWWNLLW